MSSSHIPALLPLTKHLEELGLGRNLRLADIVGLFVPPPPAVDEREEAEDKATGAGASEDEDVDGDGEAEWTPHSLRYIDVSDLSSASLDLGTLFGSTCPVLQRRARPLEVLELGEEVGKKVSASRAALRRVGWCVKEAGRRSWLVRIKGEGEEGDRDTGAREWKWGASYWGMRKVPVARADVGGMYGHYMFKR